MDLTDHWERASLDAVMQLTNESSVLRLRRLFTKRTKSLTDSAQEKAAAPIGETINEFQLPARMAGHRHTARQRADDRGVHLDSNARRCCVKVRVACAIVPRLVAFIS